MISFRDVVDRALDGPLHHAERAQPQPGNGGSLSVRADHAGHGEAQLDGSAGASTSLIWARG